MIPPSAFVDGLLQSWPYLAGAVAIGSIVGFAVPVQKRRREEVQTIIREEVQNDIKIVTRIHRKEVAIDYDVFLQMLNQYEKMTFNSIQDQRGVTHEEILELMRNFQFYPRSTGISD